MVEGFLNDIFIKNNLKVNVRSGGIASNARNGMLISLDARLVMQEEGIILPKDSLSLDLKKNPKAINEADLILTLTSEHKGLIADYVSNKDTVIMTLKEFAGECGDIEDPSMKGVKGFREVRDEIKECLLKALNKFR
jgi:protein-tyrosine-phosphatase